MNQTQLLEWTKGQLLKPCPFCGSTRALLFWTGEEMLLETADDSIAIDYSVVCSVVRPRYVGCGAQGGFRPTVELAAEAWNKRA